MNIPRLLLVSFALIFTALRAGPLETAILGAMKLSDAPNYTWVSTVTDDARTYTISGRTERTGDHSLVTLPAVSALRRRLGTGGGNSDNLVTVLYRGSLPRLVQVGSEWKSFDEVSSEPASADTTRRTSGASSAASTLPGSRSGTPPPFSNLQLTLSRPHEELAIIVASYTDARVEPDGLSGTLAETGARLLLVHPGQNELTPLTAQGTFRLWLDGGVLQKYEITLEGTLAVQTAQARREVAVHQRTTTSVSDIGKTTFAIPVLAPAPRRR